MLWFRVAGNPQHLAIVTQMNPLSIVHAFAKVGKVVETEVGQFWRLKIAGCFMFRGI